MTKKNASFLTLALLLLITSCRNPNFDKEIKQYDKKLETLRKQYNIPSISVAILHNQKIIFSKGYGYADIENNIAATDSTPYRIASITKPIASTIILKLVEEGKLNLDGKIKDYWPDYIEHFDDTKKYFEENLPFLLGFISDYNYKQYDITLRQHLTQTCEGVPGEKFNYNGFLYDANSIDSLKIIILKLINMKDKDYYKLKENSLIIFNKLFNEEKNFEILVKLYRNQLNKNKINEFQIKINGRK